MVPLRTSSSVGRGVAVPSCSSTRTADTAPPDEVQHLGGSSRSPRRRRLEQWCRACGTDHPDQAFNPVMVREFRRPRATD